MVVKLSPEKLRHKNTMEEIEAERLAKIEVENLRFDHFRQMKRIKSAEIRRTIDRKENLNFMGQYSK